MLCEPAAKRRRVSFSTFVFPPCTRGIRVRAVALSLESSWLPRHERPGFLTALPSVLFDNPVHASIDMKMLTVRAGHEILEALVFPTRKKDSKKWFSCILPLGLSASCCVHTDPPVHGPAKMVSLWVLSELT